MKLLEGKTALITGAARGIGKAVALKFAEEGANIAFTDLVLNDDMAAGLEATRKEIEALGVKCLAYAGNAADFAETEAVVAKIKEDFGSIDVLVNNAAIFNFCDVTATSDEKIATMLTLHNLTLVRLCRLYGAQMALRGAGYILNMSSYSIWMPFPGLSLYSATKAFVRNFSVAFAKELREKGVYVTAVCPAGIATDMYGLSKRLQNLGVKLGVLITPRRCAHKGLKALFRGRKLLHRIMWI